MSTNNSNSNVMSDVNVTLVCSVNLAGAELPFILLPTFILNLIAFAVFLKMKKSTESLDRLLVFSLVVNDLLSTSLYIVTCIMGWISCGRILKISVVCTLMGWLTTTMVIWSAGVITVMMSCRYLALIKPLYYKSKVTSKNIKAGLLGTLIFTSLHLIFPFFDLTPPYRMYQDNKICGYEFSPGVGGRFHRAILGVLSVEGLLVIGLVLFFNISIIHQLRKTNQVWPDANLYRNHYQRRQRNSAFVNVSILVSFCTCVCYGPFLVRLLYDVIINAKEQSKARHSISLALLFLSPLLNPVLYGVFNSRFRACLLDMTKNCILSCRRKGDNASAPQPLNIETIQKPT